MENSIQLANRFREVLLNGKWIAGTNLKTLLSDVSWQEANIQIGSLNTLAKLAFHLNYYTAGIVNVFEGGELEIRDKYSFDLPPITSQTDWKNLRSDMWTNAEKFADHVEGLSEQQLASPFVNEKYGTYRRNIEGVIEHSYYHMGQVSLIKKMVRESGE